MSTLGLCRNREKTSRQQWTVYILCTSKPWLHHCCIQQCILHCLHSTTEKIILLSKTQFIYHCDHTIVHTWYCAFPDVPLMEMPFKSLPSQLTLSHHQTRAKTSTAALGNVFNITAPSKALCSIVEYSLCSLPWLSFPRIGVENVAKLTLQFNLPMSLYIWCLYCFLLDQIFKNWSMLEFGNWNCSTRLAAQPPTGYNHQIHSIHNPTLQLHTATVTLTAYRPRLPVTLTNYPQFTRGKWIYVLESTPTLKYWS